MSRTTVERHANAKPVHLDPGYYTSKGRQRHKGKEAACQLSTNGAGRASNRYTLSRDAPPGRRESDQCTTQTSTALRGQDAVESYWCSVDYPRQVYSPNRMFWLVDM